MVRLGVYLESRDLFEKWLSLAEEQLKLWTCVRTWNKIKVLDQTESLKVCEFCVFTNLSNYLHSSPQRSKYIFLYSMCKFCHLALHGCDENNVYYDNCFMNITISIRVWGNNTRKHLQLFLNHQVTD